MHRLVLTLAILLVVPIAGIPCAPDAIAGGNAMEPDLTQYVNPMIGTKPWQEAVQVSEVEFPEGIPTPAWAGPLP